MTTRPAHQSDITMDRTAARLPPGIERDEHGSYWVTLAEPDVPHWYARYPGQALPRHRAETLAAATQLQRRLTVDLQAGRAPEPAGIPRVEPAVDSAQIDYSAPEIRDALKRAYYVLLKYRALRSTRRAHQAETTPSSAQCDTEQLGGGLD